MTRTINKKRLLKLADFLEHKVKSSWFDLHSFATGGFRERKCGSTACALGWAPTCFPRSGLSLTRVSPILRYVYKGSHRSYGGFRAAEVFFGLSFQQVLYLFSPHKYRPKRGGRMSVVRRIRSLVKSGVRADRE